MSEDGTNQHPAFYKTEKVRYSFVLADLGIAAPEQMSGQNTSTPADIHALGVLFDRLFATRPPLLWRLLIRWMTSSLPAFHD